MWKFVVASCLVIGLLGLTLPAARAQKDKKDEVPDGLKALKDPDPKVRYQSAELLAKLGPVAKFAAPALRDALKEEKVASVRVKLAEAVWKVERPPVKVILPAVVDALGEKDAAVRVAALMLLGQIGQDAKAAVPAVSLAVKDKDLGVRMEAILTLGEMGSVSKPAIPDLLQVLRKDEDVQLLEPLVTVTLSNIGAPAVSALSEAVSDKELRVRRAALSALAVIGPKASEAVPAVAMALGDKEAVIRALAAKALGKIGAEAKTALPQLTSALKDKTASVQLSAALALWQIDGQIVGLSVLSEALKEEDVFLREQACQALGEMGLAAKAAAPALMSALTDKDAKVRALSAAALGKMPGVTGTFLKLSAALDDTDVDVRLSAAHSIWLHQPKTTDVTVPVIVAALKHKQVRARIRAAELLGEIGAAAKASVPALVEAIRDENPAVRQAAALALKKVDPEAAAKAGIR